MRALMVLLGFASIGSLKWVLLAFLLCFSFSVQTSGQSCDSNDLLALRDFARNLTDKSMYTSWSDESVCCQWEGVFCENSTSGLNSSRVVMLVLPMRGLTGMISSSLGRLDYLKLLNLSSNRLEGGLPVELSNLKRLEVLDLSYNKLSGPVSGALSGLESIQTLNISSNLLSGDFSLIWGFPKVSVFNISNNSFSGEISPRICSYSEEIRIVDLSTNRLVGTLEDLENCSTSLQELHLGYNLLSGNIPDYLYSMSSLLQLTIPGNSFSGQVSRNLSKLFGLKSLIISGNQFSGEIPDIFGNLTELEQLSAHSNEFSGTLPSSLALCSKLHILDLRNNSLSGQIDLDFTGMPSLNTLVLATNNFTGLLPSSLSGCKELTTLDLAKNRLFGAIPESFGELTSLSFLSLSNNSLTDLSGSLSVLQPCKNLTTLILTKNFLGEEFPENMTGFENLMVIAFGNCGLKGKIPDWLLNCRKIGVLDLSWNQFGGNIPLWIGQMENLFYLDLSNNSLTGQIPKGLTQLKSLVSSNSSLSKLPAYVGIPLYVKRNQSASGLQYNQASSFPPSILLSNNRLTGTILSEVGQLKQLHALDLSRNNITGLIPDSISAMENLEILDLSANNLYGSIPESFEKLTFLSKFSVAYNHLQGEIPAGGQFYSFPNSSFEGNPGLCGKLFTPCHLIVGVPNPGVQSGSNRKFGRNGILAVTISVAATVLVLLAIALLRMSRKAAGDPVTDYDEEELSRPRRVSDCSSKLVLFQNANCKELTVADLLKSTSNFNQANIIGCGGFGLVYKACLPDGTKAAVKRLSGDCGQMEREFQAEVEALSRAQHKNLVSLQGYCKHGNDRLLIYSYMENGSLDYWLHESIDGSSLLNWNVRVRIAKGAAHGLAYLHKVCEPHIVHRDVKSSNILLDDKFEAHLADFGLSRLLRPYDTHVTTDLVGTLGYIPPEYSQMLTATCRGDVYSFGVVLLELLTGRRPVEVCKGKNCRDLVSWVFQMKAEKREAEIMDSAIWDKEREKEFLEMLEIACKCIDKEPRRRPLIEEVASWLDGIGSEQVQQ